MELNERAPKFRGSLRGSKALREFRRMRLVSELRRAHRQMEGPRTLPEYLLEKATGRIERTREFLMGLNLPK